MKRAALALAVLAAWGAAFAACASDDGVDDGPLTPVVGKDAAIDAPPLIPETGAPVPEAAPPLGETCGDRRGLDQASTWAMRGGCPKRGGISAMPGPVTAQINWSVSLVGGESSPAVSGEHQIWFGSPSGWVITVNAGGFVTSGFLTGGPVTSSPAIDVDGNAIVGSADGNLYKLTRGAPAASDAGPADAGVEVPLQTRAIFARPLGAPVVSSPVLAGDGTIYVGSNDGVLHAISSDGAVEKWTYATGDTHGSSPAQALDGSLYVGSTDGKLYALALNGSLAWTFDATAPIEGSPAIGGDNTIYFGDTAGTVHALSPAGKELWSTPIGGPVRGTPAIDATTIYVGCEDKKLHAIARATGIERWSYATLGKVGSPVIDSLGIVYAGSTDSHVYAVTPGGLLSFAVTSHGGVTSTPALAENELIVVASGSVFAVGP